MTFEKQTIDIKISTKERLLQLMNKLGKQQEENKKAHETLLQASETFNLPFNLSLPYEVIKLRSQTNMSRRGHGLSTKGFQFIF